MRDKGTGSVGDTLRFKAMDRGLLCGLLLVSQLDGATPAAADQPNVLVMGEDDDTGTVPRPSPVFDRMLDAIQEELIQRRFDVYDEKALSRHITDPERTSRSDVELITLADYLGPPAVDVIAIFEIFADVDQGEACRFGNLEMSIRLTRRPR